MPGAAVRGSTTVRIEILNVVIIIESLQAIRGIYSPIALHTYGRLEIGRSRGWGDTTGTLDKRSNSCRL